MIHTIFTLLVLLVVPLYDSDSVPLLVLLVAPLYDSDSVPLLVLLVVPLYDSDSVPLADSDMVLPLALVQM